MSQTSYVVSQPIAFAGLLGDMAPNEVQSKINTTGATMTIGVGVVRGTNPDLDMKLPASAGDVTNKFVGVLAHSHAGQNKALGAVGLADKEVASVMTKGNAWVLVEQAVTPDDPVFLRHTTNGPLLPGGWRKDLDTANATAVPGAKWLTSASASGFALLALNNP
jgi:hypothetical protein